MRLDAFKIGAGDTLVVRVPEGWTVKQMQAAETHLRVLHPATRFIFLPTDSRRVTVAAALEVIAQLTCAARAAFDEGTGSTPDA